MLTFHASIYGDLPEGAQALAVTFDQASVALEQLERLFIEPDGSFVWTGVAADGERWQVDGNLIDRGDALAYVEIKGRCPQERFDQFLSALGWPEHRLAFALTQRGETLEETEFRKRAASERGAV
jgi:hypothetical protein